MTTEHREPVRRVEDDVLLGYVIIGDDVRFELRDGTEVADFDALWDHPSNQTAWYQQPGWGRLSVDERVAWHERNSTPAEVERVKAARRELGL